MICQLPTLLLPTAGKTPADYEGRGKKLNEDGRPSTMEDVVDFVLEYINYDVGVYDLFISSFLTRSQMCVMKPRLDIPASNWCAAWDS
jgi:hypothetical protein